MEHAIPGSEVTTDSRKRPLASVCFSFLNKAREEWSGGANSFLILSLNLQWRAFLAEQTCNGRNGGAEPDHTVIVPMTVFRMDQDTLTRQIDPWPVATVACWLRFALIA